MVVAVVAAAHSIAFDYSPSLDVRQVVNRIGSADIRRLFVTHAFRFSPCDNLPQFFVSVILDPLGLDNRNGHITHVRRFIERAMMLPDQL